MDCRSHNVLPDLRRKAQLEYAQEAYSTKYAESIGATSPGTLGMQKYLAK